MPQLEFQLKAALTTLAGGEVLAECLGSPDISVLESDPKKALEGLQKRLSSELRRNGAVLVDRHLSPGSILLEKITIEVSPDSRSEQWRSPVSLELDVIVWRRSDKLVVARVPALAIEVAAADEEKLKRVLPGHIRFALQRLDAFSSLERLVLLERVQKVTFEDLTIKVAIRNPVEEAAMSNDDRKDRKTALEESADKLKPAKLPEGLMLGPQLARISELLGGSFPVSVLLVGASGTGKTTLFREMVRQRKKLHLADFDFYETSGSRLIAGKSGFGMWQEHCSRFCADLAKKQAVVHLGNLFELANVGASVHNAMNIAAFLRPFIARGDILVVAEATQDEVSLLERTQPALVDAFHKMEVREPGHETLLEIVRLRAEGQRDLGVIFVEPALEQLVGLHRRFATYSASPGRPLRFLDNLMAMQVDPPPASPQKKKLRKKLKKAAKSGPPRKVVDVDVIRAFSAETGLPLFMLDDEVPLDLSAAEKSFGKNVIGQPEAVNRVVDMMASIKTRMSRPDKPIASFMFIGPTGVGKTEMAKQIARFLFGDERRMARFDMSEFSDPISVNRLIGNTVSSGEGLLTAKMREQPFSVVLLDEFEKADASFFDLLLQVLGEGRLTDARGRLADFRNAVIVMTSNLGAESFGKSIEGFGTSTFSPDRAREHFESEVKKFLRPEIYNRVDRIIPFLPLSGETARLVSRKELKRAEMRDGVVMRKLKLDYGEDVIDFLARNGFDARYGARPLKRIIEQRLLTPLARELNRRPESSVLAVEISVSGGDLHINTATRRDESGRVLSSHASGSPVAALADRCLDLRRRSQALKGSQVVATLEDSISFLRALKRMLERQGWIPPEDEVRLKRLPKHEKTLEALDAFLADVFRLEDEIVGGIHRGEEQDATAVQGCLDGFNRKIDLLARQLLATGFTSPNFVELILIASAPSTLHGMIRLYRAVCQRVKAKVKMDLFRREPVEEGGLDRMVEIKGATLTEAKKGATAVRLSISGDLVWPLFQNEGRLHQFVGGANTMTCRVLLNEELTEEELVFEKLLRTDQLLNDGIVRRYDSKRLILDDPILGRHRTDELEIEDVLSDVMKAALDQYLKELLQSGGGE